MFEYGGNNEITWLNIFDVNCLEWYGILMAKFKMLCMIQIQNIPLEPKWEEYRFQIIWRVDHEMKFCLQILELKKFSHGELSEGKLLKNEDKKFRMKKIPGLSEFFL